MINVLYEELPEHVVVHDHIYPIITDFREWIRFSELMGDDAVPDIEKLRILLMWYTEEVPDDTEAAVNALGDFLTARKLYEENIDVDREEDEELHKKTFKPAFSYKEDAGCIYSAFRECYGIDLQTVEYMHWWKFQTLFDWLPETTEIKQRMMYRTIDLSSIKDKEERKRVKQIQDRIRLKKKKTEYVSDFDIGDAFM